VSLAFDSAAPWWTEADQAELDTAIWELVRVLEEHRATCPVCNACCDALERLSAETAPYDLAPLDAPRGLFADVRRRKAEHFSACAVCSHGPCRVAVAAIEALLDWRTRRTLLSKAEWLRRRHLRARLAEIEEWVA
jgi:hypothetical protein